MKRTVLPFLWLLPFTMLAVFACGKPEPASPLVGKWRTDLVGLEFRSDGTGRETYGEEEFPFKWTDKDGVLGFEFTGDASGSPINSLLTMILHGEAITGFAFSVVEDGQVLLLSDSHDHGHFEIRFERE
ncbi:MAG: hypothetical protein FWD94_00685 [Treponema sp.]|nr:hypothetical protein [Treponema sp.]